MMREALYRLLIWHQQLKLGYLRYALEHRLPDLGIGNERNNRNTLSFLKGAETDLGYRGFFEERMRIQKGLKSARDPNESYRTLKELYAISPGVHELWFFDTHFKIRLDNMVRGRLGLKAMLKARSRRNLPLFRATVSYLTKNSILLELQYGSESIEGLLETDPARDHRAEASRILKTYRSERFRNHRQIIRSGMIERLLALSHGLLKREDYATLKSGRLASKERWLYYAPCAINEGPIFVPKGKILPARLALEVNLAEPRRVLTEKLKVWDYREASSEKRIDEISASASKAIEKTI